MATIDQRGIIDDDTSNLSIAGALATGGPVTHNSTVSYPGQLAAQAQQAWYVSWLTGNDGNPGTIGSPVKTIMGGIVSKWGTTEPILSQNTTIFVLDSQPVGAEHIVLRPIMVGGSVFGIVGTPILSNTFTLGSVTAKNRTNATLLSGSGFTAPTSGQFVVNNTKNSQCFVYTTHGTTASLTQPISSSFISFATNNPYPLQALDDTWAAGNSISVYSLPALNLEIFAPRGGQTAANLKGGTSWVQKIYVPDQSGQNGTSIFAVSNDDNIVWFVDCLFGTSVSSDSAIDQNIDGRFFINCCFAGRFSLAGGSCWGGVVGNEGLTMYLLATIDGDVIINNAYAWGTCLVGSAFINNTNSSQAFGADLNIMDVSGLQMLAALGGPGQYLWGPGQLNIVDAGRVEADGVTFVSSLLIKGGLKLNGNSTMTTYATGSWVDGVPITPSNLDLYDGGQNPRTGAKFFKQAG